MEDEPKHTTISNRILIFDNNNNTNNNTNGNIALSV